MGLGFVVVVFWVFVCVCVVCLFGSGGFCFLVVWGGIFVCLCVCFSSSRVFFLSEIMFQRR